MPWSSLGCCGTCDFGVSRQKKMLSDYHWNLLVTALILFSCASVETETSRNTLEPSTIITGFYHITPPIKGPTRDCWSHSQCECHFGRSQSSSPCQTFGSCHQRGGIHFLAGPNQTDTQDHFYQLLDTHRCSLRIYDDLLYTCYVLLYIADYQDCLWL